MPLLYVLDENVPAALGKAIQNHNNSSVNPLDTVSVGGPQDLPLGIDDPALLLWAEREGRILVTRDEHSMPRHLVAHLALGHHSPGIFMIRKGSAIPQMVFMLVLVAYAGDPSHYQDRIEYIP